MLGYTHRCFVCMYKWCHFPRLSYSTCDQIFKTWRIYLSHRPSDASDTSSSVSQTSYDPSRPVNKSGVSEIPEEADSDGAAGAVTLISKKSSKGEKDFFSFLFGLWPVRHYFKFTFDFILVLDSFLSICIFLKENYPEISNRNIIVLCKLQHRTMWWQNKIQCSWLWAF